MGKGYLDILALQVNNRVECIAGHAVFQQVLKSVTRQNAATVVHNGQSDVQIRIVAKHVFYDFIVELVVDELRSIGLKVDVCTVLVLRRFGYVANQLTALKNGLAHLAIAVAVYLKMAAQRVNGLHTHTIQSD